MSINTWKEEFYSPIKLPLTDAEAIDHCLKKWRGFRAPALERHEISFGGVRSATDCMTSIQTCALCVKYRREDCINCPLVTVRGEPCFSSEGVGISPYHTFIDTRNPEPMISLLEEARRNAS